MKTINARKLAVGDTMLTLAQVQKDRGNVLCFWYGMKTPAGWKLFDVRELGMKEDDAFSLTPENALPTVANLMQTVGLDAVKRVAHDF